MRRLLTALLCAAALVAGAACSSDDSGEGTAGDADATTDASAPAGGGGSTEEFCAAADDAAELLESPDIQLPDPEAVAALQAMADAAPDAIRSDVQTVADTYDQLRELDPLDPDNAEAVIDLLYDPALIGSFEQLGIYLEAECGLDIETPSEAGQDGSEDAPAEGEVDSSALRTFLEAEDAALEARVQSIATVAGLEVSVGVRNLDDPAEAVEICDAVSGYVYDEVGATGTTIKVSDTSGTLLASREDEAASCEAA